MIAMEGVILFKQNKTRDWLKTKTDREKKEIFIACIKLGREQRQVYQKRKLLIAQHREKQLLEREKAIVARRGAAKKKRDELCLQVSRDSYWRTCEVAMTKMQGLSESKKKKALQIQIKFRQSVLKQEYRDKSVFNFSQNRKQFSSAKLYSNLTKLTSASQHPSVDAVLANPSLWVGVAIQHKFVDEDNSPTWYEGVVIGQVEGTSLFEVLYYEEDNNISEFELLEDLVNKDLILL